MNASILLGIIVGGLWGVLTCLLIGSVLRLWHGRNSAESHHLACFNALQEETKARKAAEIQLEEARKIFQEQLSRPAMAFFSDEQVRSLAKMLEEVLFMSNVKH